MKLQTLCLALILCISKIYAMEISQQPVGPATAATITAAAATRAPLTQATPPLRQDHATAAATATIPSTPAITPPLRQENVTTPSTLASITLISKQDNSEYPVHPDVIQYSGFLRGLVDFKNTQAEQQPLTPHQAPNTFIVDIPGNHIRIIAQLLPFFHAQCLNNPSKEEIQRYIQHITNNFSIISIAQLYTTLQYWIMPDFLLETITSMQQPLPFPQNSLEAATYNQQLVELYHLAHNSCSRGEDGSIDLGNKQLWQLFSRMLYPNCVQHSNIRHIINDITKQPQIEQFVLGVCMQANPQLYEHFLKTIKFPQPNDSTTFFPDGKQVATTTVKRKGVERLKEKTIVWNIENVSSRIVLDNISLLGIVILSPDGKSIVTLTKNNSILLLNLIDSSSKELIRNQMASCAALSPDGKTIALGSANIILFNIENGSTREFIGHTNIITSIVFSPDGKTLASTAIDGTMRVWNLIDGSSRVLSGHTDYIRAMAFSPDGKTLASGSGDNTIRLWNIIDGSSRVLSGHTSDVVSIVFSADGKILFSGGDKTVRRWDIKDGSSKIIHEVPSTYHNRWGKGIHSIALSPDNRTLAVSTVTKNHIQIDGISEESFTILLGFLSLREALEYLSAHPR